MCWKGKNKEKEAGNGPFFKKHVLLLITKPALSKLSGLDKKNRFRLYSIEIGSCGRNDSVDSSAPWFLHLRGLGFAVTKTAPV